MTVSDAIRMGVESQEAGDSLHAEYVFKEILKSCPDSVEAHYRLGMLYYKNGEYDNALHLMQKAHRLAPTNDLFLYIIGRIKEIHKSYEEAIGYYARANHFNPKNVNCLVSYGSVLKVIKRYDDAISKYAEAIEIDPLSYDAIQNLGGIYLEIGRLKKSFPLLQKALSLKSNDAAPYVSLSTFYHKCRALKKAIQISNRALSIEPDHVDAGWNRALALLALGNFAEGWGEYVKFRRMKLKQKVQYDSFYEKEWKGESLAGKRILLWTDQGAGDTIQFIRYAPLLKKMGAEIILETVESLVKILMTVEGIQEVIRIGEPHQNCDYHLNIMDLPYFFQTTEKSIPSQPYLKIPKAEIVKWTELQPASSKNFKIGLVWRGKPVPDPLRSCPIPFFSPLFEFKGVEWYSLQKNDGSIDIREELEGTPVIHTEEQAIDFFNTASYLQNLDLVISIDTSLAHLAGALGKRVWVLLPFVTDFRWMLNRSDSPWYPAMTLFRQNNRGDWGNVVKRVAVALQKLLEERKTTIMINENRDLFRQGLQFFNKKEFIKAIPLFQRFLLVNPDHIDALNHLGISLFETGHSDFAQKCFEHAVALKPDFVPGWNNLGKMAAQQSKYDDAISYYSKAIDINPRFAQSYHNLGTLCHTLGNYADAIKYLKKSIEFDNTNPDAHLNYALTLLLTGDWKSGFREYEWRWQKDEHKEYRRHIHNREWNGEPLSGKKILLYTEQGYGDAIQALRYVPLLTEQGAVVSVQCRRNLVRLFLSTGFFNKVFDLDLTIENQENGSSFDYQYSLFNLISHFCDSPKMLSHIGPYLLNIESNSVTWPEFTNNSNKLLKVGISWRGNPLPNPKRTCPLYLFSELFQIEGVAWYSLQKNDSENQLIKEIHDFPIIHSDDQALDFYHTASYIKNLDLIISIDTAIAHLAGSIGKPTFLLLPFVPDWRWMLQRNEAIWYQNMKIFRQPAMDNWPPVIENIKTELEIIIRGKK